MLFQQKVNSRPENINSHYFRHLVFFQSAWNNFYAQFYREFFVDGG